MKRFLSNLKMVVSVNFKALSVAVIGALCILLIAAGVAFAVGSIAFTVVLSLITLVKVFNDFRYEYKDIVKKSAKIITAKNNKAAAKARREADKSSRRAQNKATIAKNIEDKYNK